MHRWGRVALGIVLLAAGCAAYQHLAQDERNAREQALGAGTDRGALSAHGGLSDRRAHRHHHGRHRRRARPPRHARPRHHARRIRRHDARRSRGL
jgi:hypothetical protein